MYRAMISLVRKGWIMNLCSTTINSLIIFLGDNGDGPIEYDNLKYSFLEAN